jgi:hypothetical protein
LIATDLRFFNGGRFLDVCLPAMAGAWLLGFALGSVWQWLLFRVLLVFVLLRILCLLGPLPPTLLPVMFTDKVNITSQGGVAIPAGPHPFLEGGLSVGELRGGERLTRHLAPDMAIFPVPILRHDDATFAATLV